MRRPRRSPSAEARAASSSRRTASGSRSTSVRSAARRAPGGTARLSSQNDVDYHRSRLAFYPQSWQLLYATCAKLVNYPDKAAPAGSQLTAEVAEALPERSADGKTYTFTIRKGFRFSPPSNEPVTAETFRDTIERALDPRMKSPADAYMQDVVGANAYMAGKAPHISGITASGTELSVRLVRPRPTSSPAWASRSSAPCPSAHRSTRKACARSPPAGPYEVKSYVPGQGVVLCPATQLPRRVVLIGSIESPSRSAWHRQTTDKQVEAGQADVAFDGVPADDQPRLAAKHGPGSAAAKSGKQQYFENTSLGTDFITLNTHRPFFRDARLRRAVSYAIDRTTLARLGSEAALCRSHGAPPWSPSAPSRSATSSRREWAARCSSPCTRWTSPSLCTRH